MTKSEKNRILIVDDDKSSLIDLTEILESDYVIFTAKDGISAYEKANEVVPDLILLDVIMPYMNGFDVLVELKKSEKTKNIPIIFITGMRENSSEFAGLSIGAIDYIRKPLDAKITKLRVQHQIKLVNLQRDLERAAEVAYLTSQAKSSFLAIMSHEIRTPMNSILGFTELAMDDEIPTKTMKYLKNIQDNSENLLQILNDILDMSKIESGKMELDIVPFDLQELFAACRTIILPKAISKDLEVTFSVDQPEGEMPLGDPTKFRQVLVNLLSNAVKFTNAGSISFSAAIKEKSENSINLMVNVKDTGIGMTEEQIQRIFSPFSQADSGTTRKYGGTGLGLAITKNILEMMGSNLIVKSTPGVGTEFSFEVAFDTIETTDEGLLNMENQQSEMQVPTFDGEVLLCEDNTMNQIVITEYLSRAGIKTVLAQNGQVGLDMVKNRVQEGRKQFDLILMDMHMPVMDGIEASKKILALDQSIPIIAITANIMPIDRINYANVGIRDCLGKPFRSQDLWHCLQNHLNTSSRSNDNTLSRMTDEELHKKLVRNFVVSNNDRFNEIKGALESEDHELAHRLVHTLKSNASQLGKKSLANAVKSIETTLKSDDRDISEEQMSVLEDELNTVLAELRPLIDEEYDLDEDAGADAKAALELLKELEPFLKSSDADCISFIDRLRVFAECDDLIWQIETLDFKAAVKTHKSLRKSFTEMLQ